MKTPLTLVATVLFLCPVFSQEQKTMRHEEQELGTYSEIWNEGSISLRDGDEISGLVRYDDRIGILYFKDSDVAKAFTPNSVIKFQYFDNGKKRQFYTFEFNDPLVGKPLLYFFELIRQYETFAIIAKTDVVEVQVFRQGRWQGSRNKSTALSQTSTVYLMNENGKIDVYLNKIKGRKLDNTPVMQVPMERNRIALHAKELLAEYVGADNFTKLTKYADENDLSFRFKDEFVRILEYYDQLLASKP